MPVSDTHPQYAEYARQWRQVRDCIKGPQAIKRAVYGGSGLYSEPGTLYLPPPNPSDTSRENKARYESYKHRALFVGFTSNTHDGFNGMVFRKDLTLTLPGSIDYLTDSIKQQIKNTVSDVITTSRYGLLVDFPPNNTNGTKSETVGLKANIVPYTAESITNWSDSYIVLKETKLLPKPDDRFSLEPVTVYRELAIDNGVYVQRLFDSECNQIGDVIVPKKWDGSIWREIPFTFIGAVNNDSSPDKPLLLDISEVNIAHYRNSADFEESSYMTGQPTPWASGISESWVKQMWGGTVHLGSRSVIPLPPSGSMGLLQANPNQLPEKGMENKESQLVKLGANIIRDNPGDNRIIDVQRQSSGQTSKLATLVSNVESGYVQCFYWLLEFMSANPETDKDDIELTINREFFDKGSDPQMIMASIALMDRSIIAKTDLRKIARDSSLINPNRTDDDIDDELEQENPF